MGLGFVIPEKCLGFYASTPTDLLHPTIFYFEALTIASAVLWASKLTPPAHHLLIYMDSLNCINIFNTLSAHDRFNDVLLFTMHILISYNISLHVLHIPGDDNTIADTLSWHLPHMALALLPKLWIHHFQPPRIMLGKEKWCSSLWPNSGSHLKLPGHMSDSSANVWSHSVTHWTILLYKLIILTFNLISCFANYTHYHWILPPIPSPFTLSSCCTTSNQSQ